MLKGVHFLLTYMCNQACDHCFVYGDPGAKGTFTLAQIRQALEEVTRIGTVEKVYFEGGEPFLFYPIMLEGIRLARRMGFEAAALTNGYWAISIEDAESWLGPLCEAGLSGLSISDDALHRGDEEGTWRRNVERAAEKLGLSVGTLCTERPSVGRDDAGHPVVEGGVMFRGRAAEVLTEGLPTHPYATFTECPFEDLENPGRIHVDAYGNVHVCQGLTMGNMWETPLSELVANYEPRSHPICGPLLKGGPACLADEHGVEHGGEYVDACHLCYVVRRALLDRFGQYLAPKQVYGFL